MLCVQDIGMTIERSLIITQLTGGQLKKESGPRGGRLYTYNKAIFCTPGLTSGFQLNWAARGRREEKAQPSQTFINLICNFAFTKLFNFCFAISLAYRFNFLEKVVGSTYLTTCLCMWT